MAQTREGATMNTETDMRDKGEPAITEKRAGRLIRTPLRAMTYEQAKALHRAMGRIGRQTKRLR